MIFRAGSFSSEYAPLLELDLDDLEMADAARGPHHDLVVSVLAHYRLAYRAGRRDAVIFDVGLFRADQRIDE